MGGCISTQDFDVETDGRRFRLKRIVASGGFSQIYLADDPANGEKFAVKKVVCHGRAEMERTRYEINLLNRFGQFPHILPVVAVSEERSTDPSISTFCIVFPFCRFGSLQDELSQRRQTQNWLSRRRVLFLFRQICSAVELLHSAKPPVAHRDLKPANLMFSDEGRTLQLIDFGSAMECPIRIEDAQQSRRMLDEAAELCTMPYRAPELFTCEIGTQIDEMVDIWSLGCILYALCYFASPFDEVHERGDSVALAVQSAKINFNKSAPFDEELATLITSMIQSEPGKRPTIFEVRKRAEEMRL